MFVLPVLIMAAVPAAAPIAMTPTAAPRQARLGGTQLLGVAAEAERVGDARFAERAYHALLADRQSAVRNEARFRLAKIHAGRRQWSASALLLRRILDDEPSAVRVRLELAGMLEQLGDEAGARRELRAAQATRPPARWRG